MVRSAARSVRPLLTWCRCRQPPAGEAAGARPTGALAWRRVDGRLTLLVLSVQLSSLSLSSALEESVTSDLEVSADGLSLLQRTLTLMSTTLRSSHLLQVILSSESTFHRLRRHTLPPALGQLRHAPAALHRQGRQRTPAVVVVV